MAVDPVIQELMDLIEPPDNGDQARSTSDFGARRTTGSDSHGGFDENRGRGVQPHGRVTSPVYGIVTEVHPKKLGRVVIEEWDPVSKKPTGYHVEILHTQTQTVKPGDRVKPTDQIGTQGDVGAPGNFHAHIQVYHGDRTPLNPLRHLYEYHHPGEPIPPLPQFEPQQVPPSTRRSSASQPRNQRQLLPNGTPSPDNASSGATTSQFSPGLAVPGAEGPTSIGGPNGPVPLLPPARSRSRVPASPAPTADPTLPPLHFAPELPGNLGPFTTPSPSSFDAPDGADAATAGATRRLTSIYPEVGPLGRDLPGWRPGSDALSGPNGGQPSFPPVRSPPAALLAPDRNHALSDWVKPLPFNQSALPAQDAPGGIPGLLTQVGAFDPSHPDDPPAGGLLRLIQDYMRNNPDRDTTR